MAVICVDAGTTLIKAVGYDDEGREAYVGRRSVPVERVSSGWAEQDMGAVWDAVQVAVRDVVAHLSGPVDYVAVTAQGDGSWLVDPSGNPTGPAILWNDGRAASLVEQWQRNGVLEEAFRVNGSLTFAGLPNAILSWLEVHDPERLDRSVASLSCGGWVFSRLTGVVAVDSSDASAPFLDIREQHYSDALLASYGMEWARRLLPPLLSDDDRVAPLSPSAATALGLPAGTPVVMAPYDVASTAIGVGAVGPGQACSILGTTICTEVVATSDDLDLSGAPAGLTVAMGVAGRYVRAFPTLSGGEVVTWACGLLGLSDPAELGVLAAASEVGAGGLAFQPYLSPAGERAPFLDSQARGALLGLSFDHGREHVARAVLEGLTMVVRDCLAASPGEPTELRVCGGGAASTPWLQMIADVTGLPVLRSADTEVGARGAYLVGAVATGAFETVDSAAVRHVVTGRVIAPDPAKSDRYTELYADFLALRGTTSQTWPRSAAMRGRVA